MRYLSNLISLNTSRSAALASLSSLSKSFSPPLSRTQLYKPALDNNARIQYGTAADTRSGDGRHIWTVRAGRSVTRKRGRGRVRGAGLDAAENLLRLLALASCLLCCTLRRRARIGVTQPAALSSAHAGYISSGISGAYVTPSCLCLFTVGCRRSNENGEKRRQASVAAPALCAWRSQRRAGNSCISNRIAGCRSNKAERLKY